MKGIVRVASVAAASGFLALAGTAALADTQKDHVAACLKAVDIGDIQSADRLADDILEWRDLFATQLISDAKSCLEASKGGEWTYFTTQGRFLTGMEADMEHERIAKALNARAFSQTEYENERDRLECEIAAAQDSVESLEAEYENFKLARTQEASIRTMKVCYDLYDSDPDAAVLEPVCNDAFLETGLPDSEYDFDFTNMMSAKIRLANSKVALGELKRGANGTDISLPFGSDCAKFLAD